jgi:hypothetical protein
MNNNSVEENKHSATSDDIAECNISLHDDTPKRLLIMKVIDTGIGISDDN